MIVGVRLRRIDAHRRTGSSTSDIDDNILVQGLHSKASGCSLLVRKENSRTSRLKTVASTISNIPLHTYAYTYNNKGHEQTVILTFCFSMKQPLEPG